MKTHLTLLMTITTLVAAADSAHAGISTVRHGANYVSAIDFDEGLDDEKLETTSSRPSWYSANAATAGNSSAADKFRVKYTGIIQEVNFTRDGSGDSSGPYDSKSLAFAYSDFTIDADTPYELFGRLSDSGSGGLYYYVYLFDLDTGKYLFENYQSSYGVNGESLTLGEEGGTSNTLFGSLTGTLLAGHSYQFYAYQFTSAPSFGDDGSFASGHTVLDLGLTFVPTPNALVLAFLAIPFLHITRRHGYQPCATPDSAGRVLHSKTERFCRGSSVKDQRTGI